ncbi:uncharacterized protein JCM6883_000570 [Sporobolomyces salmoneus]|uniref:uncharacterized protein n=1 Tax=Sporobolomyces salmoneus TaxID=183962 RepID=UPI00316B9024
MSFAPIPFKPTLLGHGLPLFPASTPRAPSLSYNSCFENSTSSSQNSGFDLGQRTTPTPIPPPSHLLHAHNPLKALSSRTPRQFVTSTSLPHLSTTASQAEAGEFKNHIQRLTKSRVNHKRNETNRCYSTEYRKFSQQICRAQAEYTAWLKANGKTDDSLLEPNVKRQKR